MPRIPLIIIASSNQGKIAEFNKTSSGFLFKAIDKSFDVEETGSSFLENATIKAKAGVTFSHSYVLADDSGIEINALDGRPGIYAGRFLKSHGIQAILAEMQGKEDRSCRFVCCLVLMNPNGEIIFQTEQYWHGDISLEARGHNGFGYDPIVIPKGQNLTVAELGDDYKNQHSHRAKAINELKKFLSSSES